LYDFVFITIDKLPKAHCRPRHGKPELASQRWSRKEPAQNSTIVLSRRISNALSWVTDLVYAQHMLDWSKWQYFVVTTGSKHTRSRPGPDVANRNRRASNGPIECQHIVLLPSLSLT